MMGCGKTYLECAGNGLKAGVGFENDANRGNRARLHRHFAPLILFILCLSGNVVAEAQAPGTSAIAGTVLDPSGAVIAKAELTLVNEDTDLRRTVAPSEFHSEKRLESQGACKRN